MQVELIEVGWLTAEAGLVREGAGREPLRFPVPAYLIETDRERILIDTGLHPDSIADPQRYYGAPAFLDSFQLEQERDLSQIVDLTTITSVVLTHLHFDHAGGLALIPRSVPLIVQRNEWEAAHSDREIRRNGYLPRDYDEVDRPVRLIDGDEPLDADGEIWLLSTPGHTPGHQSVHIGEDLVLGGDVAYFSSGFDDHRFPLYGDDHAQQALSADRLRALRDDGAQLLPGHDPEVIKPGTIRED